MTDECEEVQELLMALERHVGSTLANIDAYVLTSIAALQRMTGKSHAIRQLMQTITNKIIQSPVVFAQEDARTAFQGLHNMVEHSPEAVQLISELLTKLQLTYQTLDVDCIISALHSLCKAPARHPQVKRLITELNGLLQSSNAAFGDSTLTHSLHALHNMSSNQFEGRTCASLTPWRN